MPIRPADTRPDDVARLRLAFIADLREVDPDSFDARFVAATTAFVTGHSASGRLRSWLAEEEDRAVGLVSVVVADVPPLPEDPRALEGYVINLYVAPHGRRRGVARALMAQVFEATAALDLRRLYLHATDQGRPLYDELDFRPDARWLALRFDADGHPTTEPLVARAADPRTASAGPEGPAPAVNDRDGRAGGPPGLSSRPSRPSR